MVVLFCLGAPVHAETLRFTTYYHNDYLGSPVAATDERDELLWRAHFRPFGERQEETPTGRFGALGYTGHAQDDTSALIYAGARHYDPVLGRFLSIDPANIQFESPVTFNRYAYGNNNPHRYVDPDGRMSDDAILAGGWIPGFEVDTWQGSLGPIGGLKGGLAPQGELINSGVKARPAVSEAKDVTKRPSGFRKRTIQDSWDNAAPGSKRDAKACPTCNKDVEVAPGQGRRDWDVDHQPKWRDRDLRGLDRKQVLDQYNKDVRLRCPSCNRSDN